MPLYEFDGIKEALLAQLALNAGVAGGAADTTDLAEVAGSAEALAGKSFLANREMSPAAMISLKEAYDFVDGVNRLAAVHGRDRVFYYEQAVQNIEKGSKRTEYLGASLQKLNTYGGDT